MKKLTYVLILALASIFVLFAGCGGKAKTPAAKPVVSPQSTPEGMEVQVPEWYAKPPSDPNYLYAPATFKATDMGFSVEHSMGVGRDELARQVAVRVTNMMKRFQEETGGDEANAEFLSTVSTVSKSITDEVIKGSNCKEKKIYKEGTKSFRTYTLMELPIGAMNAALMDKIKENNNMYTRFRASQGFQELEQETQKYEQFKKEQGEGAKPQ
jgi:hypothetical protein